MIVCCELFLFTNSLSEQRELEAASKPGADGTEVPEPAVPETKQQSIAQLIYSDNRVSSFPFEPHVLT